MIPAEFLHHASWFALTTAVRGEVGIWVETHARISEIVSTNGLMGYILSGAGRRRILAVIEQQLLWAGMPEVTAVFHGIDCCGFGHFLEHFCFGAHKLQVIVVQPSGCFHDFALEMRVQGTCGWIGLFVIYRTDLISRFIHDDTDFVRRAGFAQRCSTFSDHTIR